ncbi:MAG: STAS domain-containing protein [Pseudomonadota bacterium]|nr:STAS domain-containing protein [Pseudomonadota bacterium]
MNATLTQADAQTLKLSGAVTFSNASEIYRQGVKLFGVATTPQRWVLDLAELSQSNTIAVAVIVQWLRQLKQPLELRHVPDQLQAIMRASNLDQLLPAA